jgi:hypothetical protein
MSHKTKAIKKKARAAAHQVLNSVSTVSQSEDIRSRGDTPQTKGISYSTIKHDTTVTTDSVNEEEQRRVVVQNQSLAELDLSASVHLTGKELSHSVLQEIGGLRGHDALMGNFTNMLMAAANSDLAAGALDKTAPLLRYEDYFHSEHSSLIEQQTYVPSQ